MCSHDVSLRRSGTILPPVVRDSVVVGVAFDIAVLVCPVWEGQPATDLCLLMALVGAAGGAIAAVLAVLATIFTGDRSVVWLGLLLACYSLVAIPAATLGLVDPERADAQHTGPVLLLVHVLIVILLIVAVAADRAGTRGRHVAGVVSGACLLIAGATVLGKSFPATSHSVDTGGSLMLGFDAAWTGLALLIAVLAAGRNDRPSWWIGWGIGVLGFAQFNWSGTGPGDVEPASSGLQLLGVALVLWGTSRHMKAAFDRLREERATQEEELRLAEIRLAHTVERDHELRNGLAGLAGATRLLTVDPDRDVPEPDAILLHTVVASELERLDELLQSPIGVCGSIPQSTCYALKPVLSGLVALWRSRGVDTQLHVEPGLRARGSTAVLAEVITNLLANAAQHAPGSPVHVDARLQDDQVVLRVRDFGPGIARGLERAVFGRGVHGGDGLGLGLGLHISRELLTAGGGTILIHPSTPGSPGCTVEVRLPAAPAIPVAPPSADALSTAS